MEKLTGLNKIKTAVFISGAGSNLRNLIKFNLITPSIIAENINVEIMLYAKKGIAKV